MVILDDKKELEHVIYVLKETKRALQESNAFELQRLSDLTIHSASIHQHTDFILMAVIIYSLNKIVIKKNRTGVKEWNNFVNRVNDELDKSISELKNENIGEFARHLEHTKALLIDLSPNAKQDIEEVIRKASVNKASRIFEHGISLSKTARLLGITQWELAEYIGQGRAFDNPLNQTIGVKERASNALSFFST